MTRTLVALASSVVFAVAVSAQTIDAKLSGLDGTDAAEYFALAEALHRSVPKDSNAAERAVRLYVLAYEIARERSRGGPGRAAEGFSIPASACLAIADLEPSEQRRRWLRALAERLDGRYARPPWNEPVDAPEERRARLRLAEAVGHVLAGRSRTALNRLDEPAVALAAARFAAALDSSSTPASYERLLQLAEEFRSPPCNGNRFEQTGRGNLRNTQLCPETRGDPGPSITLGERVDYLRFESLVLDATPRSWVGELATGVPPPLLDPDPDELAPTYGIDPAERLYRGGIWTRGSQPAADPPREPDP
ncbi:MAG: hypothetical protein AAF108_00480 [Planctomycetota bacterium]